MKRYLFLGAVLIIITLNINVFAQAKKAKIIEVGESITIKSKVLNEDRKILIYLPEGYRDSKTRYPVLYALDGTTYFMPSIGIMKYHADFDTVPEMIIVAIPNISRQRDFTPTKTDYSPVSGGAANFLKFMKEELFPFIESNYRTQPYRIFSGHSLGGLCVFYALFYEPEMFNAYIAVSSAILYDDKLLLKKAKEVLQGTNKFIKSIYFSIEAGDNDYVRTNQEMAQLLEKNPKEDFRWKFKWMKDEGHVSLWVRSFYAGLEFVSPWNLPERVKAGGLDAIMEHFNEFKLDISENMLRHFGYDYWRQDNYEQAIRVFKLNVEKFPKSEETYHQLGDVYRDSGQLEIAVKTWKKGIEVAKENSNQPLINTLLQHIEDTKKKLEKKKNEESENILGSCTIFAASFGNTVLYGNNEDYSNPNTYYWVSPSGDGTYGGVFVGFDNLSPQGGINEKGLAFDYNALPKASLNPHSELPGRGAIMRKIYQNCSTVEEAIALAKKHNWGTSLRWQVLLADATGDAVVISAGPDGELAFTRKQKGDGYLVSTNFNRANPKNTYRGGYPCWRYNKAVEMLGKIKNEKDLTVDYFRSILDAVHVEGAIGNTLYSNVFDLKNGIIYLYHWHQFDEVTTLKVAEEIAKASSPTRIKDLFSKETVKRAEDEHQKYKKLKK